MLKKLLFKQAIAILNSYEGEDPPVVTPPEPPVVPPVVDGDDDKPTLSQKKLNSILAEEKRKHKAVIDAQVKQLGELQKSKSLTDKEREGLQNRVEELNNSLLTKEQLAVKERERIGTEHKRALDTTSTERDFWKSLFGTETVKRTIVDEAAKAEAFNPGQIVALLQGNTRLTEVLDAEGTPIPGQFTPKVKMQDVDKDGKPITLDLTVAEALKRMKDQPDQYGNLFKSGVAGGLGATGGKSGRDVDPSKLSPEDYRKWRNGRLGRK